MISTEPGLLLSERECLVLQRVVLEGLSVVAQRNGARPAEVEVLVGEIHRVAQQHRDRLRRSQAGCATRGDAVEFGCELGASGSPMSTGDEVSRELSTTEAAKEAGVSASFVRRLAAEGRFPARRTSRGAYAIEADGFAVWLVDRDKRREVA